MKIKTILSIVTIISMFIGILTSVLGYRQKVKAERLQNNLYSKTVEYKDELGRHVTEVTQLEITVKELKKITKTDSSELSDYEMKLHEIVTELKLSERKLKNVEKVMKLDVTTSEIVVTKLKDTVINRIELKTASICNEFGKYTLQYNPLNDSLNMKLEQRNTFYLDIYKQRKKNKKGKDVFIIWRWVKDWEYRGSVKTLNDSTIIEEFSLFDIRKK